MSLELVKLPRLLLYAKAANENITTTNFGEFVMMPLQQLASNLKSHLQVLVQTAFSNNTFRLPPYGKSSVGVGKSYAYPTGTFQRFDLSDINELKDLEKQEFQHSPNCDMGTLGELQSFLEWATNKVPLQACDTLNLWGHGSASSVLNRVPLPYWAYSMMSATKQSRAYLAFIRETFEDDTLLQPRELATALRNGCHQPGLIVLTSCRVSSLEFAYDLFGMGDYMVASTTGVKESDCPYSQWLAPTSALRQYCGKTFGIHLLNSVKATGANLALIDLRKTADCKVAIDAFIDWILQSVNSYAWPNMRSARSNLTEYKDGDKDTIAVDLGAFFSNLAADTDLTTEARSLASTAVVALRAAVIDRIPRTPQSTDVGISLIFPKTRAEFENIQAVVSGRYPFANRFDAGSVYIQDSKWLDFLDKF